jgi:hypothetical protein
LFLVEVDGVDLEIDRGAAAQAHEDVEQGIGVLAARETDHDAIACLNHSEVLNGLADIAPESFLELVSIDPVFGDPLPGGERTVQVTGIAGLRCARYRRLVVRDTIEKCGHVRTPAVSRHEATRGRWRSAARGPSGARMVSGTRGV